MEQKRNKFSHDHDNRIQKLYHDVNIHTIYNKTRLKNIKNKFCKYVNYLTKFEKNFIEPALLEYQKRVDNVYETVKKIQSYDANAPFTDEEADYNQATFEVFENAKQEFEEIKSIALFVIFSKDHIYSKNNEINKQQRNIYKHYGTCVECKKMDMVYISGCKLNHKLCSDCSDNITECPVCDEDLGLQYCAICMENKKEIVETGCENKHQTCKQCLDKIIGKNNRCPFCRDYCSKEHESEPLAIPDYWRERSEEEDEALAQEQLEAEYWRERQEVEDEEDRIYREWQGIQSTEEDWRDREWTEEDWRDERRETRDSRRER